MDQRRAATGVGGSNDTSNMRSNDQRRYRVIADKDSTPDLVSAHAAPGDRLVYDVIDDDRWSLVRIERPAEGAEPSVQQPTREQIEKVTDEAIGKWWDEGAPLSSLRPAILAAVLALFPQPTPVDPDDEFVAPYEMQERPSLHDAWEDGYGTGWSARDNYGDPDDEEDYSNPYPASPTEPVIIADVAPGTTEVQHD